MTRARDLSRLLNSIVTDSNNNVGIGSTIPVSKLNVVGVVSATTFRGTFIGDGSGLTGITGSGGGGSGLTVLNNSTLIGTASTINFTSNLNLSPISAGITTISLSSTIDSVILKNYTETVYALGNTGTASTIGLVNGNVFTATLTGNCTFTFTTGITTGAASFALILANDATIGRSIVWPASVKWPNNSIPSRTTAANATDIWAFFTPNNGTTWYGNISLFNFT